MNVYFLLCCFGIAMFLQYGFIRDWLTTYPPVWIRAFFLRMFSCSLCCGFHAGWMSYLLLLDADVNYRHMLFWAFVGGGFVQGFKDLTTKIIG